MAKLTTNTILSIQQSLESRGIKSRGGNEYRDSHPTRPGSDSNGFSVLFDGALDGGCFTDHGPSGESGNLTALCELLNITPEYEQNGNAAVGNKPGLSEAPAFVPYTFDEFASKRGALRDDYEKAGWEAYNYNGRTCYKFPAKTVLNGVLVVMHRYRFTDGLKPRFKHDEGYTTYWYGLDKAVGMKMGYIVLVNGESTTVAAQANGIPACCLTSSGEKSIKEHLLKVLNEQHSGRIYIALDGDETGRKAARLMENQLPGSINLNDHLFGIGDLGDFCGLHHPDVLNTWRELLAKHTASDSDQRVISGQETTRQLLDIMAGVGIDTWQKPLVFPFSSFWKQGGVSHLMNRHSMLGIVASSSGGKTSFMEMFSDQMRFKQSCNVFWWGPEFSPIQYRMRSVRRWLGIDDSVWKLWKLWQMEERDGTAINKRMGRPLESAKINLDTVKRFLRDTDEKWGEIYYYPVAGSMEQMLSNMSADIAYHKAQGRSIDMLFLDYMQVAPTAESGSPSGVNPMQYGLGLIKDFAMRESLVVVVGSQLTKEQARRVLETGKRTNMESMAWITPQKFNWIGNLHIGNTIQADGSLFRTPEDDSIMVTKNSEGGRSGVVKMRFHGPHLLWEESKGTSS